MRWQFTFLIMIATIQAYAQQGLPSGSKEGAVRPFNEFVLSDWNRESETPYRNIEGSPFLNHQWVKGTIRTLKDEIFSDVMLKADLFMGQLLHYNNFTGDSSAVNMDLIWEFSIPLEDSVCVFTRFQSLEKEPRPLDHFFIVLLPDNNTLLAQPVAQLQKSSRSSIVNSAGKLSDRFVIRNRFYLAQPDNTLHRLDGKKGREEAFGAHYAEVKSHVKKHQLKWDRVADLVSIVSFYNEIIN